MHRLICFINEKKNGGSPTFLGNLKRVATKKRLGTTALNNPREQFGLKKIMYTLEERKKNVARNDITNGETALEIFKKIIFEKIIGLARRIELTYAILIPRP